MVLLLGGAGLVLADGGNPVLKRLAAAVLRQELEEAPRSSQCILRASESLHALGYRRKSRRAPTASTASFTGTDAARWLKTGTDSGCATAGRRSRQASCGSWRRKHPSASAPTWPCVPSCRMRSFPP
jgi:uncharacterized protein YllA (UPF0747 family)